MYPNMHKRTLAVLAGLGLAVSACKDSTGVPDLNNVASDVLASGLTRSSVQLLTTGLINTSRADLGLRYVVFTETLGRDIYRLDANEPRFITETLGNVSDPSGFVGGGVFGGLYATVRSANTLINGVPTAAGLTDAEKSATLGLANTFKALSLYRVLETRDSLGIAIDVNHPIDDPPAPFVCKPNALAYISALLDTAKTELQAGGTAFPFVVPSGFNLNGSVNTPAKFLAITQGLKGKVELYRGLDHTKPNAASFTTAVTELTAAINSLGPTATMNGLYNTYSAAAGEQINPLADALIYLNPMVTDSIQADTVGAVVTVDKRSSKFTAATSRTLNGVTSAFKPTSSSPTGALTAPIPVLKVSELLLLRAQANIELNNFAAAAADINTVRTTEGGLLPIAVPATTRAARSAVLYEKRYSLLDEGAQRFVDLRAYKWLNNTFLRKELPTDPFQSALAIPKSETDARNVTTIVPACP
jgi:hypothetical protein